VLLARVTEVVAIRLAYNLKLILRISRQPNVVETRMILK